MPHIDGLMSYPLSERAHAKVNLHLQVLNRKPDGYHNIFSLMVKVGLHDLLKYEIVEKGNFMSPFSSEIDIRSVTGDARAVIEDLPPDSNLIIRAAKTFLQSAQKAVRINLDVEKNIPSGAGLGGGSADAAAMVRILTRKFGRGDEESLSDMIRKLGADVPFCVQDRPALCEGIGDVISPLEGRLDLPVVIVNCGLHVNTRHAYNLLGRTENSLVDLDILEKKRSSIRDFVRTKDISIAGKEFFNDFENAVFSMHPALKEVKEDIKTSGASFTIMTGSGSSMVGLFESDRRAMEAANRLSGKYSFVCNTRIV